MLKRSNSPKISTESAIWIAIIKRMVSKSLFINTSINFNFGFFFNPLVWLLLFCNSNQTLTAQDSLLHETTHGIDRRKLANAIILKSSFYVGGLSYLQFVWYKDHERVPFHFYNDNRGYLQVDKFGHTYGAYIESYIGYYLLRNAGVSRNQALLYGGTLGIVLQTPIEIFDGLYEGWGFSWGDMAANALGSGLLIGQELLWGEQVAINKLSYSESPYADMANGLLGKTSMERFFYDYNGHTYWFSMPVNRLLLQNKFPNWLNVAFGYSANGMFGEFENRLSYRGVPIPETQRYRQYLFSLDIDWRKIQTRSKLLKFVFAGMVFVKFPFPALELNSKGQVKGYWLYY